MNNIFKTSMIRLFDYVCVWAISIPKLIICFNFQRKVFTISVVKFK